jgi:hypothetical protein
VSARRGIVRPTAPAAALALLLVVLAAGGAGPRDTGAAQPAARTLYPDRFPPGPGSDIAARACVMCHSPMLVTQQAKDSLGWEKSLALMEKWGAPVTPGEHDSLRRYLLAHYGARPAGR